MTLSKSLLMLRQLIVFRNGRSVYDEMFHPGVNIIRGTNSSGKSTIADFIFFILGGDVHKWKPEAEACDFVVAEIMVNDSILSLRREVTDASRQGMSIFWGKLDEALKSNAIGWQHYPYQQSSNKDSFSTILFNTLGFPDVRGELGSNITMHQLLRLLYVDQLSSVQYLMRDEKFDQPLTRKAIGDLLFGIYDDALYEDETALREAEKKYAALKDQLNSLQLILHETKQELDSKIINDLIQEKEVQLEKLRAFLSKYDSTMQISDNEISDSMETLRSKYIGLQSQIAGLRNRANDVILDIEDSQQFINSLDMRVSALDESTIARESLGTLEVTHCPLCLTPLSGQKSDDLCHLCKAPYSKEQESTRLLRMRQELMHQAKESKHLLVSKEQEYAQITRQLPLANEELNMAKRDLEDELKKVRTKRNKELDEALTKKGQLESEVVSLYKEAKALSLLDEIKRNRTELAMLITKINISIKERRSKQQRRLSDAFDKIVTIAGDLLRSDLPREENFMNPEKIVIDYEKNIFTVNDRNQFSASSIVYLKNSLHYAIFFASLELDFFRYPGFILCDNMEDKGMEEKRSQNFQMKIVDLASKYSQPFQVIFTTSMIAPELDNTSLCVGAYYSETNKSLKLKRSA